MTFLFKIPCLVGIHKWKRVEDMLGNFGMGLEWFKCWECTRCPATYDCLRDGTHGQYHKTRDR